MNEVVRGGLFRQAEGNVVDEGKVDGMLAVERGWGQGPIVSKRAKRRAEAGSADNVMGGLSARKVLRNVSWM